MADSTITDIASEKCLYQVQERFQLDKNDEEAGAAFQKLIQESVTGNLFYYLFAELLALFPRLSEKIHKWKQYWENH
jgi:hypothetical protein